MRALISLASIALIALPASTADAAAQRRHKAVARHSPPSAGLTNGYVARDAQRWAMNSYDNGSMRNVRVVAGSLASGSYVLRGDYTYNDGRPGWVLARHTGGRLQCVEFWDVPGCRPIRGTESEGPPSRYSGPERGPNGCVLSDPDPRC